MEIVLTKQLKTIFNIFKKNKYEVYLVGGCLRDMLLKRPVHDYDLTTNATPQIVKALFKKYQTLDIGIKHGTITVIIDKQEFEITAFRQDVSYTDHRHPDKVTYASKLEDDLQRRDFTINALAYNPQTGLIDCHDGLIDLTQHTIRCIGDPTKRFQEDGLRILRALRFASVLNFTIEEKTSKAIFDKLEILDYISIERIENEFAKLLCGNYCGDILLDYRKVFNYIIPCLGDISSYSYHNNIEAINNCTISYAIRLAILLHNGRLYSQSLDSLKLATKFKKEVIFLIEHFYDVIEINQIMIKQYLNKYYKYWLIDLIKMQQAFSFISDDIADKLLCLIEKVVKEKQCYSYETLEINGNDLLEAGYSGPQIKEKLDEILKKVIVEQLPNNREILLMHI